MTGIKTRYASYISKRYGLAVTSVTTRPTHKGGPTDALRGGPVGPASRVPASAPGRTGLGDRRPLLAECGWRAVRRSHVMARKAEHGTPVGSSQAGPALDAGDPRASALGPSVIGLAGTGKTAAMDRILSRHSQSSPTGNTAADH